jgi:DNA-binding GntR family transcriptional regulator
MEFQGTSTALPPNLSESAYSSLKSMLARGQIKPGQWFKKRSVAAALNMSTTPVVGAIRRLEQEGLIEAFPRLGYRVRALTATQLAQSFEMRAALEGIIARHCAVRMSDAAIAALRPLASKLDADRAGQTEPRDPVTHFLPENRDELLFHGALAKASGQEMITRGIERLQLLNTTLRLFRVPQSQPLLADHASVLNAIASRDPAEAEKVMRQHIEFGAQQHLALFRQQFGDDLVAGDGTAPR